MKKIPFTLLVLSLFVFAGEKSFASHAVGAEITYQCLGGNNYRFFFTLYRDCAGIPVNVQYSIAATSTCGGSVSITVDLDSTLEVTQNCSSVVTQCVSGSYFGIEANYYHGDVVLPSVCNLWTFGLSPAICNRSSSINNLSPNRSTYCLYVQATLNNAAVQCNNAPQFLITPQFHFCANQIQFMHQYAQDIDGDSLVYQMITPRSDPTTNVAYIPSLSGTQPVTYTTSADSTEFDPATGDIRFLANAIQTTVVAVQINDYRNGILIGSVERDIETIFNNCTNQPPTSTGINGTSTYEAHICVDSLFSFQVSTFDADSDSTFISWSGGEFSSSGGVFQSGTFSWHPDSSFISVNPHVFILTVSDNYCPYVSTNSYPFYIYVDSCQATSGISEMAMTTNFSANYSPPYHSIRFNYKLSEASAAIVSLYDVEGREIKNSSVEKIKEAEREMDINGIAAGVYLLNLKTGNGVTRSVKVVVE